MKTNDYPLYLRMEPSLGSDIGDCYDHAAQIVRKLGCVVSFKFNTVLCGVRPCDVRRIGRKARFIEVFHQQLSRKSGCKVCYAND